MTDEREKLADELKSYIAYNDGTDPEWSLLVRCEAALRRHAQRALVETSRSKYPPRWEGLYWTRDITQPEAGPGPWEAYEWNGTLWWGIAGARGYSHTEFSEMCEIGPKIDAPRAAVTSTPGHAAEKTDGGAS